MDMKFRIEKKDAFRVVGVVSHTTYENNAEVWIAVKKIKE